MFKIDPIYSRLSCEIKNQLLVSEPFRYATPLLGAVAPKTGITLRFVTDIAAVGALGNKHVGASLLTSIASGISAYCIFFAPLYSRHIEVVRSLVSHSQEMWQNTNPYNSNHLKPSLHLLIDLINLAILISGGLELQLASHVLQCFAGLLDSKEQWDKDSLLGAAVYLLLSTVNFAGAIAISKELYQEGRETTLGSWSPLSQGTQHRLLAWQQLQTDYIEAVKKGDITQALHLMRKVSTMMRHHELMHWNEQVHQDFLAALENDTPKAISMMRAMGSFLGWTESLDSDYCAFIVQYHPVKSRFAGPLTLKEQAQLARALSAKLNKDYAETLQSRDYPKMRELSQKMNQIAVCGPPADGVYRPKTDRAGRRVDENDCL